VWIFLKYLLYVIFTLIGIALYVKYFSHVLYCVDGPTQELLKKIAKSVDMIQYWNDQVYSAGEELNDLIKERGNREPNHQAYLEGEMDTAIKESNTNLNVETRRLEILKEQLRTGNIADPSASVSDAAPKRTLEDSSNDTPRRAPGR